MTRYRPILVLVSALLGASPLAAQTPWGKVPAFPKTCFTDNDTFSTHPAAPGDTTHDDEPGDIWIAADAMLAATKKQGDINRALEDQLANMDPDVRKSRMMDFMMKNPQKAQAFMQSIQNVGTASTHAEMGRLDQRKTDLQAKFESLKNDYGTEQTRVLGPLKEQYFRMAKQSSGASNAQVLSIVARINTAYVQLCTDWILGGKFPGFLVEYRSFMETDYLPGFAKLGGDEREKLEAFGIKASAYQDTTPMEVVREYMNYAGWAFGLRSMKRPMTWP